MLGRGPDISINKYLTLLSDIIALQVYDPKKNVWRSIAELSAKRWKCGLVELGGFLYAVGGMDSPRAGFWGAPLSTGEGVRVRTIEHCQLIIYSSRAILSQN